MNEEKINTIIDLDIEELEQKIAPGEADLVIEP
jgi:hypothetical protein